MASVTNLPHHIEGDDFDKDAEDVDWIKPEYNKAAVRRAGQQLAELGRDIGSESSTIISNWRAAHAYPLNRIQNLLRYRAKQVDENCIVTQRLKRLTSIQGKLERFENMKLERMQDIGGCRAIVHTVEQVYRLQSLLTTKSNGIERCKDYINSPKEETGYRGIHLICKYSRQGSEWNGLFIEIQLRTKIQHAWATAVEVVGTFIGEDLKSGLGNSKWIEFFRKTSILFSFLETRNNEKIEFSEDKLTILILEIQSLITELRVYESLIIFSGITNLLVAALNDLKQKKKISSKKEVEDFYYVISLNIEGKDFKIEAYQQSQIRMAVDFYDQREKTWRQNNTVLVGVRSINELQQGYPNYFADCLFFQKLLERYLP